MKWLTWTGSGWRPRAIFVLTTILVACIASNPELSAFIPVIDAFGLDVLMYLFAAQATVLIGGLLWPLARCRLQRIGLVAVRFSSRAVICFMGGYLRQLLWHARLVGADTVVFAHGSPLKPAPRGAA